jgi:hypothetical protein
MMRPRGHYKARCLVRRPPIASDRFTTQAQGGSDD